MNLTLHKRDASIYRQWARWMLALDYGPGDLPSSMTAADALYREEETAIRRTAAVLADELLPHAWGVGVRHRTLYRGLRLEDPGLHGKPLPLDPRYAQLRAFSFTENREVACFFADTGAEGMLALPLPNPVTGKLGLPPHGYLATAVVPTTAVLLHWRYVLGTGPFIAKDADERRMVRWQQEVTVRADPALSVQLESFHLAAGDYVASRYPTGIWEPAPPFPFPLDEVSP